jgi:hypothetical protein
MTDEPWRASCLNCIQSCRRSGCESLSFNNRAERDSAIAADHAVIFGLLLKLPTIKDPIARQPFDSTHADRR